MNYNGIQVLCNTFPGLLSSPPHPGKGWNYRGTGDKTQGVHAAYGALSSSVSQRKLVFSPGELLMGCEQEGVMLSCCHLGELFKPAVSSRKSEKGRLQRGDLLGAAADTTGEQKAV